MRRTARLRLASSVGFQEAPSAAHAQAAVRASTEPVPVPGLDTLRLRLITPRCELWTATERQLPFPLPYWGFAWPGGYGLAKYIQARPELVRGKRVLDFGSGSGLVAIAAGMAGARSVLATDVDAYAVQAVLLNAELNGLGGRVSASERNVLQGAEPGPVAEVVLCGDCCYEMPLAKEVLDWLGERAAGGARVLLGDPGRWGLKGQTGGLEKAGEYQLPPGLRDENFGLEESTYVWQVMAQGGGHGHAHIKL